MSAPGQPFESVVVDSRWEATIKVRGASHTRIANDRGYFDGQPILKDHELAELHVSADTLEKLVLRCKQHLDLLED